MQRRSTTWLALVAVAAFSAAPLAAQDVKNPPPVPTPAAADDKPADSDIGPPGDIVVPKPEDVVPAEGARVDGGRIGGRTGDLNIRTPGADVHIGDSDGNPRVHVRAPYADVRVDSQNGINVNTPIGPIRIGGSGRGRLN